MTRQEIEAGVEDYKPTGSRMHLIRCSDDRLIIDDCYNANPQAMAAALRLLSVTQRPRRVAVLGDMGDLGALSEASHRDTGRLIAELKLDGVVAVGRFMRYLADEVPGAEHLDTVEQALPALHRAFSPGTALLVKASHAMHFEKIVEELEHT